MHGNQEESALGVLVQVTEWEQLLVGLLMIECRKCTTCVQVSAIANTYNPIIVTC